MAVKILILVSNACTKNICVIILSVSSTYYPLIHKYNPLFKKEREFYSKKDIIHNMTSEVIERVV